MAKLATYWSRYWSGRVETRKSLQHPRWRLGETCQIEEFRGKEDENQTRTRRMYTVNNKEDSQLVLRTIGDKTKGVERQPGGWNGVRLLEEETNRTPVAVP